MKKKTSKYVGVIWIKRDEVWVAQFYYKGKQTYLGRYENEEDAYESIVRFKKTKVHKREVAKLQKISNKKELHNILDYVNNLYNVNIELQNNERPIPFLRALYTKIAYNVLLRPSLKDVGSVIKRHHATILHYKGKLIPEIMQVQEYREAYLNYPKVNDIDISEKFISMDKADNLNEKLSNKIITLQNKLSAFTNSTELTDNEKAYRNLNQDNRATFDMRAEPILRMLKLNEKKRVEEFEVVNCAV